MVFAIDCDASRCEPSEASPLVPLLSRPSHFIEPNDASMAIAGASIHAEPTTATSAKQPKLVLANLPEAPDRVPGLPVLARLPDYGMRPPARGARSVSLESVVRQWFGQRTALAILIGSGVLMAALALAPLVGRSPKPEPIAPPPLWEPIPEQSSRHAPAAPPFETSAAIPSAAAMRPNSHLPPTCDSHPSNTNRNVTTESAPKALPRDRLSRTLPGSGLTRLPPIETPPSMTDRPDTRRPITVEQLFTASVSSTAPTSPHLQRTADGASTANGSQSVGTAGMLPPTDQTAFRRDDSAATFQGQGWPKAPLVDRRLSPPLNQPYRPFQEQVVSAADAAGHGTAQLEGVIETPSLRANYDPTHSQRY